ncbi:unnamed protein product [Pedinophyceae sp. YPF-701]|nr:unnamed protein product [Pedinophyceae sp. YPF-701]
MGSALRLGWAPVAAAAGTSSRDLVETSVMRRARAVAAAALMLAVVLCALLALPVRALSANRHGFIRVTDGKFVNEDCEEFRFSGANLWALTEASAGVHWALPNDASFLGDRDYLRFILDRAVASRLTVLRMFAHGTEDVFRLQWSPGNYNERAFTALDRILHECRQRGLKIILSLADNWKFYEGKAQYTAWANANSVDDFWSDEKARELYRNHVRAMLHRRNKFNGLQYRQDDTIFAWELMNEPRAPAPGGAEKLQRWLDDMAAYVRQLDGQHMVTYGGEGFYRAGTGRDEPLPATWALNTGQDFLQNIRNMDFAAIHVWPDNWKMLWPGFVRRYIAWHADDAAALGKPLVVEEYGKMEWTNTDEGRRAVRDPYIAAAYEQIEESMAMGKVHGSLFWEWEPAQHDAPGPYSIATTHRSTWSIIAAHADRVDGFMRGSRRVATCTPAATRAAEPHVSDEWIAQNEAYLLSKRLDDSTRDSVRTSADPGQALLATLDGTCLLLDLYLGNKDAGIPTADPLAFRAVPGSAGGQGRCWTFCCPAVPEGDIATPEHPPELAYGQLDRDDGLDPA